MMELRVAHLDCELAGEDFTKAISHISKSLYKLVMHSMHYSALETLGINKVSVEDLQNIKPVHQQYAYTGAGNYERIIVEGEIFKHPELQKSFFFLIYGPAVNIVSEGKTKICKLEIGIISPGAEGATNLLESFSKEVDKALKTILKLKQSASNKWLYIKESVNFKALKWYKESNKNFGLPKYSEQELSAALLMRDKSFRNQLREIGQAGFAREQDIFSNDKGIKSDKGNELIVKSLSDYGLLRTQGLLQCRKRQTPLMRLEEPEQMENETIKNLKCGLCGALYKDELTVKGYSVSELGKKLMVKSHWMTVVLTDCLLKEGIDEESILWNITDANEEVDLIVGSNDQLWVFELKDRDFGAGDAYALNYRRSRFNANKPIVFTTDKVSLDARRVFEDIEKEVSVDVKGRVIPLYIEGFDELEGSLSELISEAVFQKTFIKTKSLSDTTRYNLIPFVEKALQIDLSKFNVDDDNDLPF